MVNRIVTDLSRLGKSKDELGAGGELDLAGGAGHFVTALGACGGLELQVRDADDDAGMYGVGRAARVEFHIERVGAGDGIVDAACASRDLGRHVLMHVAF
jgi:hypothetical protein